MDPRCDGRCALREWAASGLMHLTGWPDGPPLGPPSDLLGRLDGAAEALADLTARWGRRVAVRPAALLTARAAIAGLSRAGRRSAGGAARILATADGWLVVSLARSDDPALAAAGLGVPIDGDDPWPDLVAVAERRPAADLAGGLQLVGVPAAVVGGHRATGGRPLSVVRAGRPRVGGRDRPPLVVNLSALWAGPLCASLLGRAGARVLDVESTARPDGARSGPAAFFELLHAGHERVALDLSAPRGIDGLRRLVRRADVVIEGSRPRALRHLGIDAEREVASRPGLTWVSITGYGRRGPAAERVAFGDDAAAAGGLVAIDERGEPVFCGDALADPATGLYAAVAASASLAAGGGHLIDAPLARAAAHLARPPLRPRAGHRMEAGPWTVACGRHRQQVVEPAGVPM